MAIGLGRMLGFEFKINFDYPYISRSITEFWRRWHISLSSWFREYAYIPLGGNRKGLLQTYRNIFVGVDAHRHLAWRFLELCVLGSVLRRASDAGKGSSCLSLLKKAPGRFGTHLHPVSGAHQLGPVCQ